MTTHIQRPFRAVEGYIRVDELMHYLSSDFDVPMRRVLDAMQHHWDNRQEIYGNDFEYFWNPGEIEHGGPIPYIEHLIDVLMQHEWVGDPLHIMGGSTLVDGHHRFLAACFLNREALPVYYD